MLAEHAVVGAKVVAPLRDAVRLVDGDESGRTFREHLGKAGNTQALGSDKQEVECTGEVVGAGLAGDGAVKAGVDARNAEVECGEFGDLVFHQRDERRDDERRSTKSDGGKLVAERLPCPGGHDEQQVAAFDCSATDRFLVGAKALEAEDGVQKLGEVFGMGESGQIGAEPSGDKGAFFNFTETGAGASQDRLHLDVTSLVQQIRNQFRRRSNPAMETNHGMVSIESAHSVNQTVEKLKGILTVKGVTLFAVVDHSGEAAKAELRMPNTKLLIFGSPEAGTPVMVAAPSIAIDLPLKMLVAEDEGGKVWILYNSTEYLADRHGVPAELMKNLAVIGALANAAAS